MKIKTLDCFGARLLTMTGNGRETIMRGSARSCSNPISYFQKTHLHIDRVLQFFYLYLMLKNINLIPSLNIQLTTRWNKFKTSFCYRLATFTF